MAERGGTRGGFGTRGGKNARWKFRLWSSLLFSAAGREGGRGGSRGEGGEGRGRGRGDSRGRGRGRRGQRPKDDSTKSWVPVTKLGRLVNDGKIKTVEEIYLFSLPIKVRPSPPLLSVSLTLAVGGRHHRSSFAQFER